MRELRAACALAQSPDAGRCGFETFVHQLWSTLENGDTASETDESLREALLPKRKY
jgi:hypothetical protein